MPGPRFWIALALLGVAVVAVATVDLAMALLVAACGGGALTLACWPAERATASTDADVADAGTVGEMLDAVDEPLLLLSGPRIVEANRAALDLFGDHVVGEDVRVAIRHPAAAAPLVDPALATGAPPVDLVGLGAIDRRWRMRVTPLADGRRAVHLDDRTGRHAAEKMRVDFVANASHELRTPLASILGYVETLGEDAGDDPATRRRFLGIVLDEARRMQRLIDDLISLSRIEAEKYRAPADAVDLGALAREVRDELGDAAASRGGTIEVTAEPGLPAAAGDRAQLSQLLHNLVGNALKYGQRGTPIEVTVGGDGRGGLRLAVADRGEGIAPQHLPRLTERFYRVDAGRSRSIGGTGLGLAIVKHIVERHRGRLDIASTVGEGTRVTVTLPAVMKP